MTTLDLPIAMVVAARDMLLTHRADVWASNITGTVHSWSCTCGETGPVDNREEGDRLAANHIAAVTLAAAFEMCEIREQQGQRITWVDGSDGLDESWESNGSGWAHNAVAFHQNALAHNPNYPVRATLIRRLIITTPAEPTEGAKT